MITLSEYIQLHEDTDLETWAGRIQCSPKFLQGVLSGEISPNLPVRQRIARATGGAVPVEAWDGAAMRLRTITLNDPERTQAVWADIIGCSRQYFCQIVNGTRRPSIRLAEAIERATKGEIKIGEWATATNANVKAARRGEGRAA